MSPQEIQIKKPKKGFPIYTLASSALDYPYLPIIPIVSHFNMSFWKKKKDLRLLLFLLLEKLNILIVCYF